MIYGTLDWKLLTSIRIQIMLRNRFITSSQSGGRLSSSERDVSEINRISTHNSICCQHHQTKHPRKQTTVLLLSLQRTESLLKMMWKHKFSDRKSNLVLKWCITFGYQDIVVTTINVRGGDEENSQICPFIDLKKISQNVECVQNTRARGKSAHGSMGIDVGYVQDEKFSA